jgi:translation initiation factor 2 beta subunit (eIF-2beta)/eIF-5
MDKHLGKDITNLVAREAFLKDNCDKVEEKGYMKPYTPEQLQQRKEELANASIEIAEIEQEAKEAAAHYKGKLKPLKETRARMVGDIKSKSEYVKELCYKFVDQEARETGYYNKEGDLIESRPATADELQTTLFGVIRNQEADKTGTDN